MPVRRPRVRATDGSGEVSVPAYELFNGTELLGWMAMERTLAGVSTRRYPTALEPVGQSVAAESKSTSRSAVSRKFLAMTESAMADPLAVDRHRGLARGSVPRVLGRAIGDRERAFLDGPVAGGASMPSSANASSAVTHARLVGSGINVATPGGRPTDEWVVRPCFHAGVLTRREVPRRLTCTNVTVLPTFTLGVTATPYDVSQREGAALLAIASPTGLATSELKGVVLEKERTRGRRGRSGRPGSGDQVVRW